MFVDGYKFWFAFKTDKTSYYRCSRYNASKCLGKCLVDEQGKIRHTAQHNHPPEPNKALLDKFRKTLTRRASKESTELYQIYCDESNRHVDAALLYPFTSAESAMRKARRKKLPKNSNNVKDIIDTLDHNKDLFRVHSGTDKDALYQKTITVDDCVCMIFMHRKTFDLFNRIEELHVDGSFEFVTQNNPSYYLITFHAVQGAITAPIIYSVSTAKTQSACSSIFAYIRDELKIRPNVFVSDFDPILQTSLAYIYPDTVIKGCWFHYTDAVLTQMKSFNLRKETAKGIGASALRMLLVLPLLPPEYMVPGLEGTRKWMEEKTILSEGFSSLCDYVENNWLRAVGTKRMSIFGTTKIASNHLKNFNKELSNTIGQQNPVIWVILDSLTQLATKIYVKTARKIKNLKNNTAFFNNQNESVNDSGNPNVFVDNNQPINVPIKPLKRSELISETVIASATQVWIKTPVHLRNPLLFLQLASHCINETMYLENMSDVKERNYLYPKVTSTTTVISNQQVICNPSSISSSQNCNTIETSSPSIITTQITTQPHSIVNAQVYSTVSWNQSGHPDVLQNCESPLQDLQNAPNSPSLSVILQESTFNCASITHQEFLLAQPGQAPLDSQQSSYTSCFAQNRIESDMSANQQSAMQHIQQIQCDNSNENYFTFDDCNTIGHDTDDNNLDHTAMQQQQSQHTLNQHLDQQQNHDCNQEIHLYSSSQIHEHNATAANLQITNAPPNMNACSHRSSEPPPLVFFSSVKRLPCKRILPILSEPPPLVPISSNKKTSINIMLSKSDNNLSRK